MTSAAWLVTATKVSVMMMRWTERSALDVINGGEAARVWHRPRSGRSTSAAIRFTRNLCSGSRAGCVVGAGDTPAATKESNTIGGRDTFPEPPTFPIFTCTDENSGTSRRDGPTYGVPVGEVAGAGVPKLKFTTGAFSAPGCAAKNGRGAKPNIPAIKFVGKLRTAVL